MPSTIIKLSVVGVALAGSVQAEPNGAMASALKNECIWQVFQGKIIHKYLTKNKGESVNTQGVLSEDFLKQLQMVEDEATLLRLGLLSGVWGASVTWSELDLLWRKNILKFSRNIVVYLVGKFVGHQIISYYKSLEQTKTSMPSNLFQLTETRLKQMLPADLSQQASLDSDRQYIAKAMQASALKNEMQHMLVSEFVRLQAKAFELVIALPFVCEWLQRFVDAKSRPEKERFEALLKLLPSKVLWLAAQELSLKEATYSEAIAAYAFVADRKKGAKRQKVSAELNAFVKALIAARKAQAFERLLFSERPAAG